MNWYLTVLKKYAVFSGRARRKEYWLFGLYNYIFIFIASILDILFGTYLVITILYYLAVLIPGIAVSVKKAS